MAKGRPGGNPGIVEYSFSTNRDEPLNSRVALNVSDRVKAALPKSKGKPLEYKDCARGALIAWLHNQERFEELGLSGQELEQFVQRAIESALN